MIAWFTLGSQAARADHRRDHRQLWRVLSGAGLSGARRKLFHDFLFRP